MNIAIRSLWVLCCMGLHLTFAQTPAAPPIVKTVSGLVSGAVNKETQIQVYKGIPFAAPPVGALRWKAPQPAKPWKGVRKCFAFGPSPMQANPAPFSMWSEEFLIPAAPISEDCLYLNVWTGANSKKEKRPVLVWIYGGGFNSGGSAVPIYDGEAMAQKGIVFVSLNYRVGPFGFYAHPELTKESGKNASGNYGLMDQLFALKWVQQNIAAFGGDPANVTIAGQSAGAMSVNCLVASPLGRGLFQKAIAHSGGSFSESWTPLNRAEEAGVKAMEKIGAKNVAALRELPAAAILKGLVGTGRPIVDGYVLPKPVLHLFKAGMQNKVALLTGWNEEEGLVFGPLKKGAAFVQEINETYGADAAQFLQFYPGNSDSIAAKSQYDLARDRIFGVHNFTWANMQAEQGLPVYVYRFTRKVPGEGVYAQYGAFHTGEVPYAYDNLRFVNRPWQPVDKQLAAAMSSYWANFVITGNPNKSNLTQWPAYTTAEQLVMMLGKEQQAVKMPDAQRLSFLYKHIN